MTEPRATVHLQADPIAVRETGAAELPDVPFEVVVLGDFSGRGSRGDLRPDLNGLQSIGIDRDDFGAVLVRVRPRIRLALDAASPPLEIEFGDLDDFHPDGLFDHAPLFAELRNLRRRALDPAELRTVAAQLGMADAAPPTAPVRSGSGGGGVLDQILEQTQPVAPAPVLTDLTRGSMDEVVRRLVAPYLVPGADPRQAEVLASIEDAVGNGMRLLLHHPDFQEVEALWRAMFLLVRRVETDSLLHVRIVDVARAELEADLAGESPAGGRLRQLLRGQEGARPQATLVVAAYTFGESAGDLDCLRRLAQLGQELGAPCVTAGKPSLLGATDVDALLAPEGWGDRAEGWDELRTTPAARYLGVVLPRFLLRMPYGEDADECERLAFEELSTPAAHQDYLWGNPAIACATLLAQNFAATGWEMRPGTMRDLDGLPLPLSRIDGEVVAHPTAEVWLTENAADAMLEAGVMPLASRRDQNAARIVRFQSVAAPLAPLAGRWTSV